MPAVRYRFQTLEFGEHDIHFRTLRDRRQYNDDDGAAEAVGIPAAQWSFAGMVWPSEIVLAQLMTFYDIDARKILEVGCGIGLASLVLNARGADISATDIHPCSGANLHYNVFLNNGRQIPFLRAAWQDPPVDNFGPFDAIIGSDLLYAPQHAEQLASFVDKLASPLCEVLLVGANRGYCPDFIARMQALGFCHNNLDAILPFTQPENYQGSISCFRRGRERERVRGWPT
jgi:predicted nicotinamide N-methyase